MPLSKYIKVTIGNEQVDLDATDGVPIAISYKLEDPANFQNKKSAEALSIKVPATVNNDKIGNTFHNPSIEDLTAGEWYRNFRPCVIEANGYELLVGKALLTNAGHDSKPIDYEYDFYGNNGDWIIPLREATLYDFLKDITFLYTKAFIESTWGFDGTDPTKPFVFAPVRYGQPFNKSDDGAIEDYYMKPDYMKPSLSVFWLLYRGFKSLGYRIASDFFDTPYFRKLVMPWTWGNFLFIGGTKQDNLDFLAKTPEGAITEGILNRDYNDYVDLQVTNDSINGAFDNNGVYAYDIPNKEMKWTYPPAFNYGNIDATFHLQLDIDAFASAGSELYVRVQWFRNSIRQDTQHPDGDQVHHVTSNLFSSNHPPRAFYDISKTINVNPNDVVSAKVFVHTDDTSLGQAHVSMWVTEFSFEYYKIPVGGTIVFTDYAGLQNYKFLDFLAGVLDAFNISPQTDPVNKIVYLEPQHGFSLSNDLSNPSGGYFNGKWFDWNSKQDLSKRSDLPLFADSERELLFKFKDDGNDGLLKKVQDRNVVTVGQGKYVFPERFKAGKKEVENRFFSCVVHCEMDQWKGLGSVGSSVESFSPQIVCLVPENISNTSRDEAQNTFQPKLCYYKGIVNYVGWVFDGEEKDNYPYMFAVNYQEGGEEDPILSYCDERIGPVDDLVIGKGLLRRFFLQRLAIMRGGQYYSTWFRLNNLDATNFLHREHKVCRGDKWELVQIDDYMPLKEQSTKCFLRKWVPVSQRDSDAVFPSATNILESAPATSSFDVKYARMLCLKSDIPSVVPQ